MQGAVTNVEGCEKDKDFAYAINVDAVVEYCRTG